MLDDSSAVNFASDGISVYNINFENTFGTASQASFQLRLPEHIELTCGKAVAVTTNGDQQGFYGCQFIGWQDTLYAKAGNQYYKSCYIEGMSCRAAGSMFITTMLTMIQELRTSFLEMLQLGSILVITFQPEFKSIKTDTSQVISQQRKPERP